LLRFGPEVSRSQLRPGDLVFFDTGWTSIHVGIYLDQDRFLHASKSQGVTISSLRSSYWSARHFRSIRILRADDG
jgi:lipoprotein Spr/probable lipoprotein NlpC